MLGYHSYTASVTWLVETPASAAVASRARPDWSAVYFYDRWRATLFAAAGFLGYRLERGRTRAFDAHALVAALAMLAAGLAAFAGFVLLP